ncbi:MAG TPA: ribosome biogenesis GTPase Der, partial [Spirochaetia bacterium]|nr:ribosome biogenesis GTPase Der [Spirochaetia bacterium]
MSEFAAKNVSKAPIVAIVGRPNVGKSSLFNRLIRKRKAITDPTPGVTRDPVEEFCTFGEKKALLVDTGGFRLMQEGIDALVTERSIAVMREAAVILLLMDVEETTPEDQSFMEFLNPFRERIILVVNKADNPSREMNAANYYSYGYPDVVAVSAAHGNNVDVLIDMVEERLPAWSGETEDSAKTDAIRIAIIGKPNTGKSTLLNRLTGSDRAIVSDIPGTTRDVVEGLFEYRGRQFKVLDTAGIRRKSKVGQNVEYYSVNRAIHAIDESDVVFLIIDALEGLSEQDKKISDQIIKKGRGVILVLNKWDALKPVPNQFKAMEDRVRFQFPVLSFAPLLPLSAKEG